MNYYNENDPKVVGWLRQLIIAGHIPMGVIDDRSVEDVTPNDLRGFTQCHFFAGIGGWPLALRLAGWPDDRPVWTGSCPCQPFSAAGKGDGFTDERHLWPVWFHLISQYRPPVIFGEQVEGAIKHGWLDLVQDDLEACGYAFGAAVLPAAGVGAPHIRSRGWFVADSKSVRSEQELPHGTGGNGRSGQEQGAGSVNDCAPHPLADSQLSFGGPFDGPGKDVSYRENTGRTQAHGEPGARCKVHPLADSQRAGLEIISQQSTRGERQTIERGGPISHWSDAEWLPCRDGKARPVEPGTFPLAHGVPARVVRLRGYGNAIVPQVAAKFIKVYMEITK